MPMTQAPPPASGVDALREALKSMPVASGVYRMINEAGDVMYVGKAKHLKNRISQYTVISTLSHRILRMVSQIARVEITITGSEAEALLLEANLIKKLRPRYNILLKDDKSFPYVLIDTSHPFPRITKHRGASVNKGLYFGPFASAGAANHALAILQKAFLLRPCTDSIFTNRSRPCLQYQIKRCSAPCVNFISESDYADAIKQAVAFLKGKNREVQDVFAKQMQAFSDAQDYEKAAAMRDRIAALTRVQQEQQLNVAGLDDADVMAITRHDGQCCIQVFFFRGGGHFGNLPYFPNHDAEESDEAILAAFITQFYQIHTPPSEILISHDVEEKPLIEEALSDLAGYRITIARPQRGDKLSLIHQVMTNAESALQRHLHSRYTQAALLDQLAALFHLPARPKRVEVYDNSHISGSHAVGAMIVAGPEGFMKGHYRRFNIRTAQLAGGDDYGMMREVFTRRFSRLKKEDPDRTQGLWPDLVLIDGGVGQLNAVTEIFTALDITNIAYVGISKGPDRNAGREQFHLPNQQPFTLPPDHGALHFMQRLRDEAHRYAIGSHRIKRANAISHSGLDDIPNIGAKRKKELLHHFGSKRAVETATLSELENVPGISKKIAHTIFAYFHS